MPSHPDDVARAAALASRGQVPPGGGGGFFLMKNGPDDFDMSWGPVPPGPIMNWMGDPNGVVQGNKGVLLTDRKTPALYQNANGDTTWTLMSGGGGSASFPIVNNDGTYTQSILVTSHDLFLKNVLNAGSVLKASLQIDHDGFAKFVVANGFEIDDAGGGINLFSAGGGVFLKDTAGGGVFVEADSGGGMFFDDHGAGGTFFTDHDGGGTFFTGLPISAPGGSDQLWRDALGFVRIT